MTHINVVQQVLVHEVKPVTIKEDQKHQQDLVTIQEHFKMLYTHNILTNKLYIQIGLTDYIENFSWSFLKQNLI